VIAGGKKIPEKQAVELAHAAIRAGASGVDMGRNIFQSDCPVGMIRAVRAVVHEGAGVKDAFAIYREQKEVRTAQPTLSRSSASHKAVRSARRSQVS
jgi:putative autoinducer-2 (AI-2) aldolase